MIRFAYSGVGFAATSLAGHDPEALLALHRAMLRIRMVEEEIERRYPEDEMKTPIHLSIGQEATSVGVCAALRREDYLFGTHRSHANYLAKGGDLRAMMAELYGRITGCAGSRGGSMHLVDVEAGMVGCSAIVGGVIPLATGAGVTAQLLNQDRVAVAFFGDGAAEEGVLWESLNFAALRRLPVLYVCENNYYSVCTPLSERQPEGVSLVTKAAAFGVAAVEVDGTNVLAVLEVARQAVARAKRGEGATFIESRGYRFRGHHGAGDDSASGYRDPGEVVHWQQWCPVVQFEVFLEQNGLLSEVAVMRLREELAREIREVIEAVRADPMPLRSDLATHLYDAPPAVA